jgi:hypothetical protein
MSGGVSISIFTQRIALMIRTESLDHHIRLHEPGRSHPILISRTGVLPHATQTNPPVESGIRRSACFFRIESNNAKSNNAKSNNAKGMKWREL